MLLEVNAILNVFVVIATAWIHCPFLGGENSSSVKYSESLQNRGIHDKNTSQTKDALSPTIEFSGP